MPFTTNYSKATTPSNIGVVPLFTQVTIIVSQAGRHQYGQTSTFRYEKEFFGPDVTEDMASLEVGEWVDVEMFDRVVPCVVVSKNADCNTLAGWRARIELECH